MQNCHRLLIILLLAFSILTSGAGAEIIEIKGGYVVESVTPGMETGTPFETVAIEFWELPPWIMMQFIFLSVSSYIGFPVEFALYVKMYVFLGFRKISRKTVLSNESRSRIYSCIRENPGIIFSDLVRETGINRGNVAYHLNILKTSEMISAFENSGNAVYFENSGVYSGTEKTVLKHIRNDKDRLILRSFLEKPSLTRKDIGELLGSAPSTVGWRMKRLSDDELVRVRKSGKNVQYEINPDICQYLEKYIPSGKDAVPGGEMGIS